MNTSDLANIVLVVILIEAIVEGLKPIWDKEKGWNKDVIMAILVAIVIFVTTGADFFEMIGSPLRVPYIGSVFSALIGYRGANYVHDLIKKLNL